MAEQIKSKSSTESQDVLRLATSWGMQYVKEVYVLYEQNYPDDLRLQRAIEVTEQYLEGAKRGKELREVSMEVFKIGKTVEEYAKYITKAVSAIAAVPYTHTDLVDAKQGWMQARHVLGPVVYSVCALEIAKGNLEVCDKMLQDAIISIPGDVRKLICTFPPQPEKKGRVDQLFLQIDKAVRLIDGNIGVEDYI